MKSRVMCTVATFVVAFLFLINGIARADVAVGAATVANPNPMWFVSCSCV